MKQIKTHMNKLRLHGMAKSWEAIQESRMLSNLSLSDGVGMELFLQAEEERDQRRFKRLQHHATFRYKASMEEVKPNATRRLDKTLLHSHATGSYVQKGEAILITGATGYGKSFLSSAFGHQACI